MKAEMQLTILEDGTISIQTGNMAGEHHASADEFIKLVHQLAGGGREMKSTREHHRHHHHHYDHHHDHRH
jgi:hypothetical protein